MDDANNLKDEEHPTGSIAYKTDPLRLRTCFSPNIAIKLDKRMIPHSDSVGTPVPPVPPGTPGPPGIGDDAVGSHIIIAIGAVGEGQGDGAAGNHGTGELVPVCSRVATGSAVLPVHRAGWQGTGVGNHYRGAGAQAPAG